MKSNKEVMPITAKKNAATHNSSTRYFSGKNEDTNLQKERNRPSNEEEKKHWQTLRNTSPVFKPKNDLNENALTSEATGSMEVGPEGDKDEVDEKMLKSQHSGELDLGYPYGEKHVRV